MSGPGIQFGHIATYGRKISANHSRKGTAWTVGDIAKEASRDPDHSKHVENPQDPIHLHGFRVHELEQRMNEYLDVNKVQVEVKGVIQERKARADAHTLMTGVYSWPEHMDQWDKMDKDRLQNFIDDTLAFHKAEFGEVHSAEMHIDEDYPHLHVYTMNPAAKMLHPGEIAKKQAYDQGLDKKASNKAYRDAMKGFQDRYFEKVGIVNGLERLGPERMRMTRTEFRKEKLARVERGDMVRSEHKLIDSLEQRKEALAGSISELQSRHITEEQRFELLKENMGQNVAKYRAQKTEIMLGESKIAENNAKLAAFQPEFDKLQKRLDHEIAGHKKKIREVKAHADAHVKKAEERAQAAAKAAGFLRSLFAGAKQMVGFETALERDLRAEKEQIQRVADAKVKEAEERIKELWGDAKQHRDHIGKLENKLFHAEHELKTVQGNTGDIAERAVKAEKELMKAMDKYVSLYESQTPRTEWTQAMVDQVLNKGGFSKESQEKFGLKGIDTIEQENEAKQSRGYDMER